MILLSARKERKAIKETIVKIEKGKLKDLDVKKLKERTDIFRVRKGDIRIIYRKTDANKVSILAIERRSEKTYRKF